MKAIENGKIIPKDRVIEDHAVLISDVIEGILPTEQIPQDAEIIDAQGDYIAPGLINLHIHGYLGKDVRGGDGESISIISKGLLANGVTGYLPTTMTVDMKAIRQALETCRTLKEESKDWDGSVILGCHAEGPFISESKKGAQDPQYILNHGARNVWQNSSIPLHECVNCASLNPTTVLGIDDRKGSIEVGKDADIILLDKNFEMQKTIIGGKIKYEA